MITLKNLHLATKQEVFDQVARHLLTQMEISYDGKRCLYRHIKEDGTILKCAAGCLIADDEYIKDFERKTWLLLIEKYGIPNTNARLISRLQILHDTMATEYWKSELYNIANYFNLNTEVLNEF